MAKRGILQFCSGIVACMALLALLGAKQSGTNGAPVNALNDRDVYYPGTEDLKPDEMRIVACGTGMPNARPRQAAACFLLELGNGDKFIFDIGLGSAFTITRRA